MNWEPGSLGRRLKCIESWGPVCLKVARQVPIPIKYKGLEFTEGFRTDLIVTEKVLVELNSVEAITAGHKKQVQTYLALTGLRLGYLINFGDSVLKNGITRCVNKLEEYPPPNLCASASLRE